MMTREIERRLAEASEQAKRHRHEFVTLEHILLSLTESAPTSEVLTACGVDVPLLRKDLDKYIKSHCNTITDEQLEEYGGIESWNPEFTLACHRLIQRATIQMKAAGKNKIGEVNLLIALYYESECFAVYSLAKQNLSQFDLINYASHGLTKEEIYKEGLSQDLNLESGGNEIEDFHQSPESSQFNKEAQKVSNPSQNGDRHNSIKSKIGIFCQNLNEKARNGKTAPLIGRTEILERIVQTLARKTKNNPILIGEPGVGKTALIEGLAHLIVKEEVPPYLKGRIIFSLDLGGILAGTKYRGDFEARIKGILEEVESHPNYILFIDEIHTLVGAGSTSGGSMDAANLLKPFLTRGTMSCIGSTTHTEFRQFFEKDRALSRRFQKIEVPEPTVSETKAILEGLKSSFETHHNVKYTDEALSAAVNLSIRHIHGRQLPDKAIDLLDEAGARARLNSTNSIPLQIGILEIESTLAQITGIPSQNISSNEKNLLRDLDKKLKSQIFGQEEAIDKLAVAVKFSRSGLSKGNKPIGSFLFTGPTGVGKTEVCRSLASILGVKLIRFDMSEYMEKHSVARLVGAPPGYVGYDQGGLLTEQINKNPHCILLFDEMEKAHPDIYNILLQVMDAGRLTDSNGRIVNFENVMVVLTSNAGAHEVSRGSIGLIEENTRHFSMEAIRKIFSPEFLNRLDAIVTFKSLEESTILLVVDKLLSELKISLLEKRIDLIISDEVKRWIMKRGYSPTFGARPIGRTIDQYIKAPLAESILFGPLESGGKVHVSIEGNFPHFRYQNGTEFVS